jgi:hypothetical protein
MKTAMMTAMILLAVTVGGAQAQHQTAEQAKTSYAGCLKLAGYVALTLEEFRTFDKAACVRLKAKLLSANPDNIDAILQCMLDFGTAHNRAEGRRDEEFKEWSRDQLPALLAVPRSRNEIEMPIVKVGRRKSA